MSAVALAATIAEPVVRFSQLAELDLAALAPHPRSAAELVAIAARASTRRDALRAQEVPFPGPRPAPRFGSRLLPRTIRAIVGLVYGVQDRRLRDEHDAAHARRSAWHAQVGAHTSEVEREVLAWRDRLDPTTRAACTDDLHAALDLLERRGLRGERAAGERPQLGWFVLRAALAHD